MDGRAGTEQRSGDLLLVGQRDAGNRGGQQRAGSAGDQAQQEIVRTQCLRLIQEPGGGRLSRLVGYGVGRLDDFDPRARHAVAIRRDREPAERRVPGLVGSLGHNRRRLAGTQDQGPAARWAGEMPDDEMLRVGRIDDRVEHPAKGSPVLRVGVATQRLLRRRTSSHRSIGHRPSPWRSPRRSCDRAWCWCPLGGAPAQGTGGGAGSPFTGVAPEGTGPGAGRTVCALLPRHGPGSAGPAGDGTPVRPGTGPEGRPCRMWCSLLSVIARSSCRRSDPAEVSDARAGGDIQIQGPPACPSDAVDGTHPSVCRDGLRPAR